jgi:hypothetical protein
MTIQPIWKKHPLYAVGAIEEVPTEWVLQYFGQDVSPTTALMDGSRVNMTVLWDNLLKEGLHNPFIMRVGLKNKKFRLESGNHRIQLFHQHGVRTVPLTVQVRDECGPHLKNVMTDASHNFDAGDEFLIESSTEEYLAPSRVFRSLSK